MQQQTSEITQDVQEVHKDVLRNSVLNSCLPNSLLGGQTVCEVIGRHQFTPVSVRACKKVSPVNRGDWETLDDVISRDFSPGSEGCKVLLYGGVGIGKTTAVENIIWDWASGRCLQHYTLLLRMCVKELSTLEEKPESLQNFLTRTHAHLSTESIAVILKRPQSLLLVFDGLDGFKNLLSTPPSSSSLICDAQQEATSSVLLCSLVNGSLLSGASMLATSREPLTIESWKSFEMVGFSQNQRRTFFQRFFDDESQAERLFWHSEQMLGVSEQCFCPAFCWILCNVFKTQFEKKATLPETLSHLFGIVTHTLLQKQTLNAEQTKELVSGLGRLARLCSANTVCSYSDVISCGMQPFLCSSVLSDFLYSSGDVTSPDSTFSFLSPLMQEFLLAASFYIDQSENGGKEILNERPALYYTFLAGLSDPGQCKEMEDCVSTFDEGQISKFFQWLMDTASTMLCGYDQEKHFHIFYLLQHARKSSLVKDTLSKSQWRHISYNELQEVDCITLSYVVSCMGEMEYMNLYSAELTEEKVVRLVPALRLSKSINLSQSRLSLAVTSHLSTALAEGRATTLDFSHCKLEEGAFKILCHKLSQTKLEQLQLCGCSLTSGDSEALVKLISEGSELRVLDLYGNKLQDHGLIQLSSALKNCRLQEINLDSCSLSAASMPALSAALSSGYSDLKMLNLGRNSIEDEGMETLSQALQTGRCGLNRLNLYDCDLTDSCCSSLAAALQSEHCCLTELDLSVNEIGQSGGMLICEALKISKCRLEKLGLSRCELTEEVFRVLGDVLTSAESKLISLSAGLNKVGDAGAKHIWKALRHKNCKLQHLDLEMLSLTDACVDDLCQAVAANNTLTSLILKNNVLTDASIPRLVKLMQDCPIMSKLNLQYNDFSEDYFELMDSCPNIVY
ncbi:NACHT, LRR and PYD domains-containing protein 9 [Misgurnus anguillicaudatus]|uniref:NACHT, LRR and PYD domains-containing protein 9 n=1 Tax=Misgurnus anguillicaudatus TaxID=75329 RepID=UPI003CCFA34A